MGKSLVLYFSAEFGSTKAAAEKVAQAANADIFEIVPEQPYTREDLYWPNPKCRSVVETKSDMRPAIAKKCEDIADYDNIFLGFPIWCAISPTIVNTFLEAHDLSGKTIIPFATSGGSGYGPANRSLQPSLPDSVKLLPGTMLNRASQSKVDDWVAGLGL